MSKFHINKNILLVITLVVLAVAGYFLFLRGDEEVPVVTTETNSSSVGAQLVVELNRLKALQSINGNLFNDPAFKTLTDITQPVTAQPLGRSNPFLPIGSN